MIEGNLSLLLPQIIMAVAAIVVMLSIAVKRSHKFVYGFTIVAFAASLVSLFFIDKSGTQITPLLVVDGFSSFFTGLIVAASLLITMFSYSYFRKRNIQKEEYYILLLIATLGSTTMAMSNHFISFFLSLELLSVSLYAMIAYMKHQKSGIEAGIKYLILAAVSAAIMLFGFALIYAQTGEMQLGKIALAISNGGSGSVLFVAGIAMVIAGLGFKLALVPFHFWTPDIYSGSAAPVSAFVATVSKGSVFAFILRFYFELNGTTHNSVWVALAVLSISSMLIGNWLALRQQNIKRLLAYSSIGHLGYMIVPLLATSADGVHAAIFYLVTYFVAMLGAFGVVSYLSGKEREANTIEDFRGLVWEKPWIAALMTTVMLSLAGIPLTAGFLGKFYILLSGVGSALWLLVIVLVVSSGIGLFYYLRVVFAMFSRRDVTESRLSFAPSVAGGIVLTVVFILLFWFGMFPAGLLETITSLVGAF